MDIRKKLAPRLNRLPEVMLHCPKYSCKGRSRLAEDCGCNPKTLSRLVAGRTIPTAELLYKLTAALEEELDVSLDPREIFSLSGHFTTANVCRLVACHGCLPWAYDATNQLKPEYEHIKPGHWSEVPELQRPALRRLLLGKVAG